MSSIPEDLYLEILIRVPVKTTLVCKCVCKKWLDLISSSEFVQIQLRFNIQKNNYNLMLKNTAHEFNRSCLLQSISYDLLSATGRNACQDSVVQMDYPFKSEDYWVTLRCSYHGLVFLCFSDIRIKTILCLWNPATTEFKIIPEPPRVDFKDIERLDFSDIHTLGYQFPDIYSIGYDQKMDDYKLIKLIIGGKNTVVYIYTLGSNSWKCIGTIPYKFSYHSGRSGEIVSGALHWLVKTASNFKAVVSFDATQERFQEFQLPENYLEKKESINCNTCLAESEGYLYLLVNSDNYEFDVWVMQEYGVHNSWAKRSSITLTFVGAESFYTRNHVWSSDKGSLSLRFMCYFKNGKILFGFCGDLILYDLERDTYERIRTMVGNVEKYVESLVSLNSGTYVRRLKTRGVNLKRKGKDIVCGW